MSLTLFSWLLILSAILSLGLALFALSRRVVTGSVPFALALFGEFVWCAGYWWELHTPGLDGKLFWDNLQFLGVDLGVTGAFLFAWAYTGHRSWRRRTITLLAIMPALTILLAATNPLHQLVRSGAQILLVDGQSFLTYTYGPWFWIFVAYDYLLTIATLGLLISFAIRSYSYRQPVLMFVLGFSTPAIGALMTVFGLIPIAGLERLDISPLTFAVTCPLMAFSLFRRRLLDIVPVARTLLIEQMRDAVLVVDVSRRVVDTNAQSMRLLRQPDKAIIGSPVEVLLPALGALMLAVNDNGRAELHIDQLPPIDIEATCTTLRDHHSHHLGWLVVLRDITTQAQQARYQQALSTCSQILLRGGHELAEVDRVLDNVLGLMRKAARVRRIDLCQNIFDADGALHAQMIAEERSPEVIPFPLSGCLPWSMLPDLHAALAQGQMCCGPVGQLFPNAPDLVHTLADGAVHALLLMPLYDSGGWWGLVRVSTDRSDHAWDPPTVDFMRAAADMIAVFLRQREATQALLQAKDDAEAANRAKSTFLSMMSHELRTPLTAIIGYSQLMEQLMASGDYRTVSSDLHHIYTAGKHLLALINDVLDLSRIEAGKLHVEVSRIDLADLVRSAASTVRPLVERNRNTLQIDCPSDLPPLTSDATKVRQVLLNLLNNAAKFTENGMITLSVAHEQVAGAVWITFRVSDTGIGIAPSQISKLFKPFSQVDEALNRRYGGTGLGLALSQRLCQLLGGEIVVESQLGMGAVFSVRLPMLIVGQSDSSFDLPAIRPVGSSARQADALEGQAGLGFTPSSTIILVIDDHPEGGARITRLLGADGAHVVYAPSGPRGIELARDLLPDLIVVEVLMSTLDGWQVLAALKAEPELAAIPVVLISMDDQQCGLVLGLAEMIAQPDDHQRLTRVLHSCAAHTAGANPAAPKSLLVVEARSELTSALRPTLAPDGWQVDVAATSQEALALAARSAPTLIVIDLFLPEDVIQLVHTLRTYSGRTTSPIILLIREALPGPLRATFQTAIAQVLQTKEHTYTDLRWQLRQFVASCQPSAAHLPMEPANGENSGG